MSNEYQKKVSAERIIQVTVDKVTKDALKKLAELEGRTLSNFSSKILKDFLKNQQVHVSHNVIKTDCQKLVRKTITSN